MTQAGLNPLFVDNTDALTNQATTVGWTKNIRQGTFSIRREKADHAFTFINLQFYLDLYIDSQMKIY